MSTISRRDFMKTAGVMTLAVAASAALAGCSTEDAASSASASVAQETLDQINAKTTYHDGDVATFGAYKHEISATADLYLLHQNEIYSNYAAVLAVQITMAAGDEITTNVGKADYLGKTYTKNNPDNSNMSLSKNTVTLTTSADTAKLTQIKKASDLKVYQSVQNDDAAKAAAYAVIPAADKSLAAAGNTFELDADWVTNLAGCDIDKGGKSIYAYYAVPLDSKGQPTVKNVTVNFYNSNYMKAGSSINFSIDLTAQDLYFSATPV